MTDAQRRNALVLLAALLGALTLRIAADRRAELTTGITVLASDDRLLWAALGDELLAVDEAGEVVAAHPLAAVGITGGVADLQPLADGLLVGDREGQRIVRCDRGLVACEPFAPAAPASFAESFDFVHDPASGLSYIADVLGHRTLVDDRSAGTTVPFATDLRFPNDLLLAPDGTLRVVDTNHHRMVAYRAGASPTVVPALGFEVAEELWSGHRWPYAALPALRDELPIDAEDASAPPPDAEAWWMLVGGPDKMRDGELWLVRGAYAGEHAGSRVWRVLLPGEGTPAGFARFAGGLLIADAETFEIWRAIPDPDMVPVGWGGATLKARLAERRELARGWERLARLGLLATLALSVALLAYAFRLRDAQARTTPVAEVRPVWQPAVAVPGVRWAPYDATTAPLRATSPLARYAIAVAHVGVLVAMAGYLLAISRYTDVSWAQHRAELLNLAGLTALDVGSYLFFAQRLARRLGGDGRRLVVVDGDADVLALPATESLASDRSLLVGGRVVPLTLLGRPLFEPAVLAQILADVPRVADWRLRARSLARHDLAAWAQVVGVALLAAGLLT